MSDIIEKSERILKAAIKRYNPTHIVSMVSGGTDSAASHNLLKELGIKVDFVLHGNTRTGIPETTQFVIDHYGKTDDVVIADAGNAYEQYLMRKGFFGVGRGAHNKAFRILKAGPFRKALSKHIRQGRRGYRIMMINGARKYESKNREKNLKMLKRDPAAQNNIWVNPLHFWTNEEKDEYVKTRQITINPVAKALCRSGECMCGTMQSKAARVEAAAIYPNWGNWLDELEAEVVKKHGWGWGEEMPEYLKAVKRGQGDLFLQSMICSGCEEQS